MAIPGLALPGLNLHPSKAQVKLEADLLPTPTRQIHLKASAEFRFEAPFTSSLKIKLLSGTAELFGTELAPNISFAFSGTKAAIFTWHGCTLEVTGATESEYVAEETEMTVWANLHFALENARARGQGPRVCVVGPENAGKTSLLKTLTAYAVNAGRQPVVVNLDPRQGLLSVPGSLTATAFATQLDVEEGWGTSPFSGPSAVPVKMPLVYHYGMQSPEDNARFFKPLVTRLALAVTSRMQTERELEEGGCFIDTAGSISSGKGGQYEIIRHIVSEFSVNILLVLGSERLHSDLSRKYASRNTEDPVTVIKLARSGGCVDREEKYMQQLRQQQVRQYFFGREPTALSPYTQMLDFGALSIFKILDPNDSSKAFRPGDDDDDDYDPSTLSVGPKLFEPTEPIPAMNTCLLAITHAAATSGQDEIRDSSCLGYVYVVEVDETRKRIRCLAPVGGRMPGKAILWGTWPEGVGELLG